MRDAVEELVGPVRARMAELGMSQAGLAVRLRCDRSRVSRMVGGRQAPTGELVVAAARILGLDVGATRDRWRTVVELRRRIRVEQVAGRPPGDIEDYPGLVTALVALVRRRGLSHRELVRRDPDGRLRRSTVGAVLRGQRSASRETVIAIVQACGVTEPAYLGAWDTAWHRVGLPHHDEQHQRQIDGLHQRNYALAMRRLARRPTW